MNFTKTFTDTPIPSLIPEKYRKILEDFFISYQKVVQHSKQSILDYLPFFNTFVELVKAQIASPYEFGHFHKAVRSPIDYYRFGIEFLRPAVDMEKSSVIGWDIFAEIEDHLAKGDNVVLFANHQIEADPQAISLLLEKSHNDLAENMIFVAGDRVISDPLAVPFSLGRNLLCIYSKKYLHSSSEEESIKKQEHNKKTIAVMAELLQVGGKCIYVAPSGGRDRPNEEGIVTVAPFDEKSIEMFYLIGSRSDHPTHFYPLALSTYEILPPPEELQVELGEARHVQGGSIHLAIGKEIDMENYAVPDNTEKPQKSRYYRSQMIFDQVVELYNQISYKSNSKIV